MSQKRSIRSPRDIYLYWRSSGKFGLIEQNQCFSCQDRHVHLERCHIVDRVENLNDDISNIHLLCGVCHKISDIIKYKFGKVGYQKWLDMQKWTGNEPKTIKEIESLRMGFNILSDYRRDNQQKGIERVRLANGGKCPWGGSKRTRDKTIDTVILRLKKSKLSIRKIAIMVNRSPSTVQKTLKHLKTQGLLF